MPWRNISIRTPISGSKNCSGKKRIAIEPADYQALRTNSSQYEKELKKAKANEKDSGSILKIRNFYSFRRNRAKKCFIMFNEN